MNDEYGPPCGIQGHDRGHEVDEVVGIWWCPDCGTEIWLGTEESPNPNPIGDPE